MSQKLVSGLMLILAVVVGIPATMIASRLVIRRQPMAFWAYFACSSFAFYLLMAFVRYGSLHYRFMDIF
jgi:hypothetical protein